MINSILHFSIPSSKHVTLLIRIIVLFLHPFFYNNQPAIYPNYAFSILPCLFSSISLFLCNVPYPFLSLFLQVLLSLSSLSLNISIPPVSVLYICIHPRLGSSISLFLNIYISPYLSILPRLDSSIFILSTSTVGYCIPLFL